MKNLLLHKCLLCVITLFSGMVFYPLAEISRFFNGECMLGANIHLTQKDNGPVNLDLSQTTYGDSSDCDFTTYINVTIAVVSIIFFWFSLFLHSGGIFETLCRCGNCSECCRNCSCCGRDCSCCCEDCRTVEADRNERDSEDAEEKEEREKKSMRQEFKFLVPFFVIYLVLFITSMVSSSKISGGLNKVCDNIHIGVKKINCLQFEELQWSSKNGEKFYFHVRCNIVMACTWLLLFIILFALVAAVFKIYQNSIILRREEPPSSSSLDAESSTHYESSKADLDEHGHINKGMDRASHGSSTNFSTASSTTNVETTADVHEESTDESRLLGQEVQHSLTPETGASWDGGSEKEQEETSEDGGSTPGRKQSLPRSTRSSNSPTNDVFVTEKNETIQHGGKHDNVTA